MSQRLRDLMFAGSGGSAVAAALVAPVGAAGLANPTVAASTATNATPTVAR